MEEKFYCSTFTVFFTGRDLMFCGIQNFADYSDILFAFYYLEIKWKYSNSTLNKLHRKKKNYFSTKKHI